MLLTSLLAQVLCISKSTSNRKEAKEIIFKQKHEVSFHKQEHKWENIKQPKVVRRYKLSTICARDTAANKRLVPVHMVFTCGGRKGGPCSRSTEHATEHSTAE